jgi:hypothetical protein
MATAAAVELATTGLPGRCGSGTACSEERREAGAAEELGNEDGGVALCFDAIDPLQRVGPICTGKGWQRQRVASSTGLPARATASCRSEHSGERRGEDRRGARWRGAGAPAKGVAFLPAAEGESDGRRVT